MDALLIVTACSCGPTLLLYVIGSIQSNPFLLFSGQDERIEKQFLKIKKPIFNFRERLLIPTSNI